MSDMEKRFVKAIEDAAAKLLPELRTIAKEECRAELDDYNRRAIDLQHAGRALMDRLLESEAAARQFAAGKATQELTRRWAGEEFLLNPAEGMLGNAVEGAIVLLSQKSDPILRHAWLRKRGWIQRAAASVQWVDPTTGGVVGTVDAIKIQVMRDMAPFEFLLTALKRA